MNCSGVLGLSIDAVFDSSNYDLEYSYKNGAMVRSIVRNSINKCCDLNKREGEH